MLNIKESTDLDLIKINLLNPPTILVVDDEQGVLTFIKIRLQASGYKVLTAKDGFEALELLKNNHTDMALVDLMMPQMSGLELIEKIRKFTQIPIIVITASDSPDTKFEAFALGANEFLTKPFNPDDLVSRIKDIFQRQ